MNSKISFQTLNRHKLVDDVVKQLQKKISDGEIRHGDKIPTEPELMRQFGVGRSTIREAVRVLVHAGLLEKRQGYGTYLIANPVIDEPLTHRLRRAEILEVYEVRKMLELEISRLAAKRRDDVDLEEMRSALDQRLQALERGDTDAYLNADLVFHQAVAVASKNRIAADMFRSFSSVMLDALHKLATDQKVHDPQHDIHENLYQAILEQDEAAAVHWTMQNLDRTVAQLEKLIQS